MRLLLPQSSNAICGDYPGSTLIIRSDVQPVIEQIQRGEFSGDQVQGTGYTIFKVRIRNSDASRGKSGGYRVIYYLKTATAVILVTIYSKTEQSDISPAKIKQILSEFSK